MSASKIVVVGSLNMDFVVRAPRIPSPGETVLGANDLRTIPGGKGANQAVAAARLGATVTMIGRIGADPFGRELTANLESSGVSIDHIGVDPDSPTGVAMIVVDQDGQNSIVVSSGANNALSDRLILEAEHEIAAADILLIQLEIPLPTVISAARIARKHGVRTLLNPAPSRKLPPELLSLVDIILPNETETEFLTGLAIRSDKDVPAAITKFLEMGVESVVITRGDKGCSVHSDQGTLHFASFAVHSVDSTGAGDAFVGGFAVALTEGQNIPDAALFGNAAGALATTVHGAQPSMPERLQLNELLREKTTR